MQLAPSADADRIVAPRNFFDLEGNIRPLFAHEPVAQLVHGDMLSVASGKRACVDEEFHRYRRLSEGNGRKLDDLIRSANRVADINLWNAGKGDDIACTCAIHLYFL